MVSKHFLNSSIYFLNIHFKYFLFMRIRPFENVRTFFFIKRIIKLCIFKIQIFPDVNQSIYCIFKHFI